MGADDETPAVRPRFAFPSPCYRPPMGAFTAFHWIAVLATLSVYGAAVFAVIARAALEP